MKLSRLYIIFETNGYSLISIKGKKDNIEVLFDKYYPFENENNSYAIKQLCFEICNKIRIIQLKNNFKVSELVCIAQNSEILLNEIELLSKLSKREINKSIDIRIDQIKGLDSRKYIKCYDKLEKTNNDFTKFRVCIFPIYIVEIMKEISKISKIKCQKIYASYQIIDNMDLSEIRKDKVNSILEFREEDLVLYIQKNERIESTIVVKEEYIDSSFISYLSMSNNIIVLGNKKSKIYKTLEKDLELENYLGRYNLIKSLENNKKPNCNFYKIEESKSIYMKIIRLFFIFLLIVSIKSISLLMENQKLESEKESKQGEVIEVNRLEGMKKNKNFDNIYGIDIWRLYDISSILSRRLRNLDIDQEKIILEFILSNKSELASILAKESLEGAEIEYIRTEEISRKEADEIYGIGDNDEESNQKAREKNNNKEKSGQESNQKNKEKNGEKYKKEESNQARKKYNKEESDKKEAYKKSAKEKNSEKSCCKKNNQDKKENILDDICGYLYSYAEESVENIEVFDTQEEVITDRKDINQIEKNNGKNYYKENKEIDKQERYREERNKQDYGNLEKESQKNENKSTINKKEDKSPDMDSKEKENESGDIQMTDARDREIVKVLLVKIIIKY